MDFHILLYLRHMVILGGPSAVKTPWGKAWCLHFAKSFKPGEAYSFLVNLEVP